MGSRHDRYPPKRSGDGVESQSDELAVRASDERFAPQCSRTVELGRVPRFAYTRRDSAVLASRHIAL